jgi:hypothetical protein
MINQNYNTINLTRDGIIIQEGIILQKKLKVDIVIKDNSLKLSYYDKLGIYNCNKVPLSKFTFLYSKKVIIGILPLDSDYYICWNPEILEPENF